MSELLRMSDASLLSLRMDAIATVVRVPVDTGCLPQPHASPVFDLAAGMRGNSEGEETMSSKEASLEGS